MALEIGLSPPKASILWDAFGTFEDLNGICLQATRISIDYLYSFQNVALFAFPVISVCDQVSIPR